MFDASRFLTAEFGSPQDVIPKFLAYGVRPPEFETVRQWYRRSSIPGDWFATILCILELDRGEPISLTSYIRRI